MARRRTSSRYAFDEQPRKRLSGEKLQKLRAQVFNYYGDACWLCGGEGADTIDHIVPVIDGGDDSLDNLRPAHGRKSKSCTGNYSRKRNENWDVSPMPKDKSSELPDGITFGDRCIIIKQGSQISTSYVEWEKLGIDHPHVQWILNKVSA